MAITKYHSIHLTLLWVVCLASLASLAVSAALLAWFNQQGIIAVPDGRGRYRRFGFYLHSNAVILAASVLLFVTATYFLVANMVSSGRRRSSGNSIALEIVMLLLWWLIALVGAAIFTSDIRWSNLHYLDGPFVGLAASTLAFAWFLVVVTTGLVIFLLAIGLTNSKSKYDGSTSTSIWSENTRSMRERDSAGYERRRSSINGANDNGSVGTA